MSRDSNLSLVRALLGRESGTSIDPEFKRSAQAYADKHQSPIGVYRDAKNILYWSETKLQPDREWIWTTLP